ncbi:MAG: Cof-type HAD-IIB family hydrolase [bacterium]
MKKNKIKLIALDIDGTIMDHQFKISDRVKETILKAINSNIYVVLATGRMYSSTVPIALETGILTPLITYQGSLIKEFFKSDKTLLHHTISTEQTKKIIEELRNFKVQINVYIDDKLYIEDENHIIKEYAEKRFITYHKIESFDKITDFEPTKILAIDNDIDKVTEIKEYLKNKYMKYLNITKSTPEYCEVVSNLASKAKAILYLADIWDIKQSEIMAIGDQDNDKEMLKIAGTAVAMKNCPENLKKTAHYITDTVDNDGAALAIEKFAFALE